MPKHPGKSSCGQSWSVSTRRKKQLNQNWKKKKQSKSKRNYKRNIRRVCLKDDHLNESKSQVHVGIKNHSEFSPHEFGFEVDTTRSFMDRYYKTISKDDHNNSNEMDFYSYSNYEQTTVFGYDCKVNADHQVVIVHPKEQDTPLMYNSDQCDYDGKDSKYNCFESSTSFQSKDVIMGLPPSPDTSELQAGPPVVDLTSPIHDLTTPLSSQYIPIDAVSTSSPMECVETGLVPYTPSIGSEYHEFSMDNICYQYYHQDSHDEIESTTSTPHLDSKTPSNDYIPLVKSKWDDEQEILGSVSTDSGVSDVPASITPLSADLTSLRSIEEISCRDILDFHMLGWVSKGSFGSVYRAADYDNGHVVAIKKIQLGITLMEGNQIPLTIFREIKHQWQCDHPNIVKLESVALAKDANLVYLIMEYIDNDMTSILSKLTNPFSTLEVKSLMTDLVHGVDYLHRNNIMHRDIKPSNLLLTGDGVLKIGDLGLAREIVDEDTPEEDAHLTPVVVTLWYRAPEVLLGSKCYGKAVDMWSVACVMFEFITGKPLFPGRSDIDQIKTIFSVLGRPSEKDWPKYGDLPGTKFCYFAKVDEKKNLQKRLQCEKSFVSDFGFDLINRCLMYNPEKRLEARGVLDHPWFQEVPSLDGYVPSLPSISVGWMQQSLVKF